MNQWNCDIILCDMSWQYIFMFNFNADSLMHIVQRLYPDISFICHILYLNTVNGFILFFPCIFYSAFYRIFKHCILSNKLGQTSSKLRLQLIWSPGRGFIITLATLGDKPLLLPKSSLILIF